MKVKNKKTKNEYKKLLIIIAIIMPIITVAIILADPNMLTKLKGNISPYIVDGIKTYEVGDFVYFDPVNYDMCNMDQSSATCFRWMVISKNDNNYNLFLLNNPSNMVWDTNPAGTLNGGTSNWSNKLSVYPSYDITVTESFKLNFSDGKARLLLRSEYDSLPDNSKEALKNYCQKDLNLVVKPGLNTNCGILNTETRRVEGLTSSGVFTAFSFDDMANGATLNPSYPYYYSARPVVNITIDDQMGNKDNIIKQIYDPGDIIYFDPVSEDECKETVYDEAKVNKGESTCYRWRVISTDDNSKKEKINIQLDHNLANTRWNRLDDISQTELDRICAERVGTSCSRYDYNGYTHMSNASMGPKAAMLKLAEVTANWTRVPLLNFEYDVSDLTPKSEWNMAYSDASNYGVFKCVEGTCSTSHWNISMGTGLRARLITADEVAAITKQKYPDAVSPTGSYSDRLATDWNHQGAMSHDGSGRYVFSNTSSVLNSKDLWWLLENTCSFSSGTGPSGCTGFGRNTNRLHTYYWTLTPVADGYAGYSYAWNIYDEGCIYPGATNLTDTEAAIRPVIEYQKNYIEVTVTYNDEERITQTDIAKGSTATPIDSQGKEGYTFLYWSKSKKGTAFDFNTPIYKDITLYAVYSKTGCEVIDERTMVDYIEDLYNDDALINNLDVDNNEDHNLRYINKTPNNYVRFNNELWRILGIFNVEDENGNKAKRVKIVRDTSFSGLAFDSTPYANPPINAGQGINDWSESDLMKLLNPGFEDNEEETFKYENNQYISEGFKRINNSLYWNKGSGNCISNEYNKNTTCDFTETGLSDSSKQYIDTVVWNTGAIPFDNSVSPYTIYNEERGSHTTKDSEYNTIGVDDTVIRGTRWIGKVGVPYISDYLMASGPYYSGGTLINTRDDCFNMTNGRYGSCTSNNDWMTANSAPMTSITSVYGLRGTNKPYLSSVAFASTVYSGSMNAANLNMNIKPTVYLKTNTQITGGIGSQDNPYEIGFVPEQVCSVVVTYDDEGRITTKAIPVNSTAEVIDSQGKEGYTFKYWSLDRTNVYDFNTPVSQNITLYAVYEISKYNVEFVNNNEVVKTQIIEYGNKIDESEVPEVSKEGYTFKYWSEDEEHEFDMDTIISRNYRLYSVYSKKPEPEDECILSISSDKYEINKDKMEINNVPEKASTKEIESNLIIKAKTKSITDNYVIISCDDKEEKYKINRIKILSTGQLRTRYGIIMFLVCIITGLLIIARKKRLELKGMIQ